jgi:hypothetical protein
MHDSCGHYREVGGGRSGGASRQALASASMITTKVLEPFRYSTEPEFPQQSAHVNRALLIQ